MDGCSLFMASKEDLKEVLNVKMGPFLKVWKLVTSFRPKAGISEAEVSSTRHKPPPLAGISEAEASSTRHEPPPLLSCQR